MGRASSVVDADHHQFLVRDAEGGSLSARLGDTEMLVHADADEGASLSVMTGAQYGDVEVTAILLDAA